MSKIKIRFNTKDETGDFPWRVFVDDKHFLASNVEINGFSYGEKSVESGIEKWNIVCDGTVVWIDNKAIIQASV